MGTNCLGIVNTLLQVCRTIPSPNCLSGVGTMSYSISIIDHFEDVANEPRLGNNVAR